MPLDYHKSASAMIAATIGRSVSSDVYCFSVNASQKGSLSSVGFSTVFKRRKKEERERKKRGEKKSSKYAHIAQTVTASITKVTSRSVFLNHCARWTGEISLELCVVQSNTCNLSSHTIFHEKPGQKHRRQEVAMHRHWRLQCQQ